MVSKIFQNCNEKTVRISAQKSKKWWNQRNKGNVLACKLVLALNVGAIWQNKMSLVVWIDHFLDIWAEILTIFFVAFLKNCRQQNFILK